MGGYALAAACKAKSFFCRCFYADLVRTDLQRIGNVFPHLINVGAHLRFLRDDRRINIADLIPVIGKKLSDMLQQTDAGDPLIGRICIREMAPDVSERSRAEKRIARNITPQLTVEVMLFDIRKALTCPS